MQASGSKTESGRNDLGDAKTVGEFRAALLDFFARRGRDLPWRRARNPYRVLVSEFMLQQTRVETVRERYVRWLRRFPGWRELAAASRDEVLLEWKGMGYYARARNLHRTARIVCERHGGELPPEPKALKELPGVGDYTAGAVASIAFGRAVPAVDGNVRRVLCRLLDLPDPSPRELRDLAARLLHPTRPGHHNEAMMELGATVCTPRTPRCPTCPVRSHCAAHRLGTVRERPLRKPRRPPRRVDYAAAVAIDRAGRVLLVRRPEGGLLGGMWEFPTAELPCDVANRRPNHGLDRRDRPADATGDPNSGSEPLRRAAGASSNHNMHHAAAAPTVALERLAKLGLRGVAIVALAPVRHAFTHLRARYHPVVVSLRDSAATAPPMADAPTNGEDPATARWVEPARLDAFALPVAQQKIAEQLIAEQLGDMLE